jgi:hypothetical protein
MLFTALMMTNNIVLLTGLTMVITFTYVTFCHQQRYSERTYLFCHQRQYSERTYYNTCFLPLNCIITYKNFEILWNFLTYWLAKSNFCAIKNHIRTLVPRNFIHWVCTRVQYDFFIAQKLLFANQYVRKWNVTCISSGQ